MTKQVEDWAQEFGGDYEINIFGRSVVVLTSAPEIRQVLHLRPSKFRRGFASVSRCRRPGPFDDSVGLITQFFSLVGLGQLSCWNLV